MTMSIHFFCLCILTIKLNFKVESSLLLSRLVFTGDGVVVGVVIRSAEWYDLVKIKLTESEAEHCIRL